MTLATELLSQAKAHARIDSDDEDDTLLAMLATALADVLAAANVTAPATLAELPDDLAFAVCDQTAMLFDARGGATERDRPRGLTMAATTICARYRGVSVGALE